MSCISKTIEILLKMSHILFKLNLTRETHFQEANKKFKKIHVNTYQLNNVNTFKFHSEGSKIKAC